MYFWKTLRVFSRLPWRQIHRIRAELYIRVPPLNFDNLLGDIHSFARKVLGVPTRSGAIKTKTPSNNITNVRVCTSDRRIYCKILIFDQLPKRYNGHGNRDSYLRPLFVRIWVVYFDDVRATRNEKSLSNACTSILSVTDTFPRHFSSRSEITETNGRPLCIVPCVSHWTITRDTRTGSDDFLFLFFYIKNRPRWSYAPRFIFRETNRNWPLYSSPHVMIV